MNFIYILVAVVLVSVTVVYVGFLVKTCVKHDDDDKDDDEMKSGAVVSYEGGKETGGITPYQLPRIAVTAASVSPAPRSPRPSLGASFSAGKKDGKRGSVDDAVDAVTSDA